MAGHKIVYTMYTQPVVYMYSTIAHAYVYPLVCIYTYLVLPGKQGISLHESCCASSSLALASQSFIPMSVGSYVRVLAITILSRLLCTTAFIAMETVGAGI